MIGLSNPQNCALNILDDLKQSLSNVSSLSSFVAVTTTPLPHSIWGRLRCGLSISSDVILLQNQPILAGAFFLNGTESIFWSDLNPRESFRWISPKQHLEIVSACVNWLT